MKIDRNNYESFFIDHFEGMLSENSETELRRFLHKNPDLAREFESFEILEIPAVDVSFPEKNTLKKQVISSTSHINENNYPDFFTAKTEGDLNQDQIEELDRFLGLNPQLAGEQAAFHKARLIPDLTVLYPDKAGLKKRILIPLFSRQIVRWSAAAAVLVLLASAWLLLDQRIMVETDSNNHLLTSEKPAAIVTPQQVNRNPEITSLEPAIESDNTPVEKQQTNRMGTQNQVKDQYAETDNLPLDRTSGLTTLFSLPVKKINPPESVPELAKMEYRDPVMIPQYIDYQPDIAMAENHNDQYKRPSYFGKVLGRLVQKTAGFLAERKSVDLLGQLANIEKPEIGNVTFQSAVRGDDSKVTYLSLGDDYYILRSKSNH